MQIKIVVIDPEFSPRARRRLIGVGAVGLVLTLAAVAFAAVPNPFEGGQPISALAMNQNFAELDQRFSALASRVESAESRLASFRLEGAFAEASDLKFEECQANPDSVRYCGVMASAACERLGFDMGWYRPNVDGILIYTNHVVCIRIPD